MIGGTFWCLLLAEEMEPLQPQGHVVLMVEERMIIEWD